MSPIHRLQRTSSLQFQGERKSRNIRTEIFRVYCILIIYKKDNFLLFHFTCFLNALFDLASLSLPGIVLLHRYSCHSSYIRVTVHIFLSQFICSCHSSYLVHFHFIWALHNAFKKNVTSFVAAVIISFWKCSTWNKLLVPFSNSKQSSQRGAGEHFVNIWGM